MYSSGLWCSFLNARLRIPRSLCRRQAIAVMRESFRYKELELDVGNDCGVRCQEGHA